MTPEDKLDVWFYRDGSYNVSSGYRVYKTQGQIDKGVSDFIKFKLETATRLVAATYILIYTF